MKKILAAIVTYNPDLERLQKNINAIEPQVEHLIIVDNGSKNINLISRIKGECKIKIDLIENKENIGIASALNQALDYAYKNNFDWILTLDQDSICDINMISEMKSQYEKEDNKNIALIAPNILDENITLKPQDIKEGIEYTGPVITSGSLTKTNIAKNIGGFVDKLFIDQVDFDFCLRLKDSGADILKVNRAIIYHQLGEISEHKLFGKTITTTNHSPIRRYYYYRNLIYMYEHHKENHKEWINLEIKHAIKNIPRIILFEKNKTDQIKSITKGILDAKKGKYGQFKK
ncbi:glycosyl transferase family 2 [Paraclostridium bifermentans]|uniref:glycosyltransferase family 2 protein n=1 Tax=Paraclostridium bifermentans TaxID=1490 RepID=UPI0021C37FDA|nr:glycosyltransferase family 2 protein [Paraclostridium bifermentans]GKZ04239.1 glycosyl transferase family 2 [Paraclostridium bifermentans]GKZ06885.1 glycosyl transferase family 2 [Paraclostridium bifermentans]GKZ10945.1 glycosyl transferase family 2 [Paraclostridium bifermentans]